MAAEIPARGPNSRESLLVENSSVSLETMRLKGTSGAMHTLSQANSGVDIGDVGIKFTDTAIIDAFGRMRVSEPLTLFDSKQLHDNQPLFFDDQETSGAGTSSSHDTDTASSTLGVSATTAGTRVRQTFMRFNYQPGKSQLTFVTGTLDVSGGGTGIKRCMGIYDDNDGIFLLDDEGTTKVVCRSSISGSAVDTEVAQSSWNIDPFDGTGPSGVTLDLTKSQIFIVDFEWLGVGRVRTGFVVDGLIYYCHQFTHANIQAGVYTTNSQLTCKIRDSE